MRFRVRTEDRLAPSIESPVVILEEEGGAARAEIAPGFGFNCWRWTVRDPAAGPLGLLYDDPQQLVTGHPTRTGIPILFPFPNRIRDGRFVWGDREYRLPLNDPAKKNAIHGFACRRPWRVTGQGADEGGAWVTGTFQGSVDAPEELPLWPADYRIQVTCRLGARTLRIEALVENPDDKPLPFGLGYHPYFRVPLVPGGDPADWLVSVPAQSFWELQESLPTGRRLPVAQNPRCDLSAPRRYTELQLDDVLTDLPGAGAAGAGGLALRGTVAAPAAHLEMRLRASPSFDEVVVYTPPHRQAVALEPYTCATDAMNLEQQGMDAGLLVLQPGQTWAGAVEMELAGG
jgi:aldose 1-epimerase